MLCACREESSKLKLHLVGLSLLLFHTPYFCVLPCRNTVRAVPFHPAGESFFVSASDRVMIIDTKKLGEPQPCVFNQTPLWNWWNESGAAHAAAALAPPQPAADAALLASSVRRRPFVVPSSGTVGGVESARGMCDMRDCCLCLGFATDCPTAVCGSQPIDCYCRFGKRAASVSLPQAVPGGLNSGGEQRVTPQVSCPVVICNW